MSNAAATTATTSPASTSAQGKAFDGALFRRVFAFTGPYRLTFWITFTLTIVLAGLGVVRPLIMGRMIDDHAMTGDAQGLLHAALIVCGLLVVETIIQFYQAYWTSWLGQAVTFDLRQKLYARIMGFKLRWFDRTPIGTLVTRVVSDIETIDQIFSQGLLLILGDLLKLAVVVVAMFVWNWELALLSMVPIPLLLWSTNIFKNSIRKSFQDVRTQVARLNAFVQEHIQGMSVVQLFGRERQEYEKFQAINREHRKAHIRSVLAYSIFFPVVEILSAISLAFLVWWGVKDVLGGGATVGDIFIFIFFINMLFRPIRQLADRFNVLQMGMVGSERVFKVLDTEAGIADRGTLGTEDLRGDIAFEGLWFAYAEDDFVLKDVSFSVRAGEMVALVGATGSGKSSIINVLSRAYDHQRGRVTLDGRDIRDYRLADLRRSIAVVLQDVFLFSDTVHHNITLNDPAITREDVIAAAQEVGAHDFIMRLPKGYDTEVRERGGILSTGQRQLIAFIRAAVHRPKVLVLDEATSSVDSTSEQLIQQATERLTKGRTSIVIAHRLSTVQGADRILVLDAGRIVESGDHQELLAQNGRYRKLYDLQFR
ncbi:MAG: ABC transporter ATP-binding protein [Flavobacteriales bacterium]|nr:ABC transporter ATP-binding protein [Flavobacteriales bacterium]